MNPDVALPDRSRNSDDDDAERSFRRELDAMVHEYAVPHGGFPVARRDFDAVVVTGSRASVYYDEVTDHPPDAVRLAGNDNCDVQAFRRGHASASSSTPRSTVTPLSG